MEDSLELRDGEGMGYELLWANPYLPGVSYQNMQPWWYSEEGRLLARSDWSDKACWISVSPHAHESEHCPSNWQAEPTKFGSLLLKPMTERCVHMDPPAASDVKI